MASASTLVDAPTTMLDMLESRLHKIEYLVNGDIETSAQSQGPASANAGARLRSLERSLQTLAKKSYAVADVLELHKQHPDLFHATSTPTSTTLLPTELAQLVLAHAQLYNNSAASLSTLSEASGVLDLDPAALSRLVTMESRAQQLQAKQTEQAREVAELRARSAKVVEKWYANGVLAMGDRWAEWEEKMRDCEILVRRKEAMKRREEGVV